MMKAPSDAYARVGLTAEQNLRWLLRFGDLDREDLSPAEHSTWVQDARTFMLIQETDPGFRPRLRSWVALRDDTPNVLSVSQIWRLQRWLRQGLGLLRQGKKWGIVPKIRYEMDVHHAMFWARLKANSRVELFKALVYDALRDARFNLRLCPECSRPFVPVKRQAYCSVGCSQATRTRKWRKSHPEKNREIRRQQYQRLMAAELGTSK